MRKEAFACNSARFAASYAIIDATEYRDEEEHLVLTDARGQLKQHRLWHHLHPVHHALGADYYALNRQQAKNIRVARLLYHHRRTMDPHQRIRQNEPKLTEENR